MLLRVDFKPTAAAVDFDTGPSALLHWHTRHMKQIHESPADSPLAWTAYDNDGDDNVSYS